MRNFIIVVAAVASTEFLSFLSGSPSAALVASALVVPSSTSYSSNVRLQTSPLASSVETKGPLVGEEDAELSPMLREIVDERREFQMNVGRAMDTLRKDYPDLLKREFDFKIYHADIQVKDPTGVQFSKLTPYKNSLAALRLMANLAYDTDASYINNRMVYDAARGQIRVSFNAVLFPKVASLVGGFGSSIKPLHVDGISVYTLDRTRRVDGGEGKILEHRIERILVNDVPVRPPYFGLGQRANVQQQGVVAGAWN